MDNSDTHGPLRALEREVDPPAALERRVRGTLAARGLLRRRSSRGWRRAGALAAAAVLFALGYLAGSARPQSVAEPAGFTRYALFLYEDATFDRSRPEAELVAEYSEWGRGLRESGRLEAGEKLADAGLLLERRADSVAVAPGGVAGAAGDAGTLTGLFVIRAASESEALRIAGTCPHLSHGGRVLVRRIIET